MKYLLNNVEVSKEQVRELLEANPELLEEKTFPQEDDEYWYMPNDGDVFNAPWDNCEIDKGRLAMGNCFQTKEQAIHSRDFDKATVAIWNWAREHAPFVPDWGDDKRKCFLYYNHDNGEWCSDWNRSIQTNFHLPYFATSEDTKRCIEECAEHLEVIKKGRHE